MKKAKGSRLPAALVFALLAAGPVFAQAPRGTSGPSARDSVRTDSADATASDKQESASRSSERLGVQPQASPPTAPERRLRGDRPRIDPVDAQVRKELPGSRGEKVERQGAESAVQSGVLVPVGTLPAGKSIRVFFDVTVNSPFPNSVTQVANQGIVSGSNFPSLLTDDPDDPTTPDMDPTVTEVVAAPILAGATKTVSDAVTGNNDGQAQPGEILQYEVLVVNSGNGGDLNVSIVDTVPAGTTLDLGSVQVVLSNGAAGFVNNSAGNTVDVTVSSMPGNGSQALVAFQVTVDSPVAAGLELLSNLAQVFSDKTAPFDTTQADIVLDAVPELTLVKDDGGVTVDPLTTVVYNLFFENTGLQDASGVELEETVPVGSTFDDAASTAGWSCADGDPEGTLCTLAFGPLASAASGSVDFAVEVVAPQFAPDLISNTATVRDDGTGSGGVPVEATDSDTTPVNDLLPPTIANVDTVKGNGDGVLEECESVATKVSAVLLTFSEDMFDPVDDIDPNDVTNPANYLVVGSGPDLDLETDTCGPLVGDDVAIAITGVTYEAGSTTATVEVDSGSTNPWLDDGPYRVITCSGGLRDDNGNDLDGDGDFTGGDDFVRYFRVDEIDAFANGHFDCGLDDWTPMTLGGSTIEHEPLMDIDNALISGSAHFTNEPANNELALGQCVDVGATAVHDFTGNVFLDTPATSIEVIRTCEFFASDDCSGIGLPAQAFFTTVSTDGVWVPFAGAVTVPATASSGLCQVTLRTTIGAPYEAFLDDLSLDLLESPVIFEDGFESGDTGQWDQTVQ